MEAKPDEVNNFEIISVVSSPNDHCRCPSRAQYRIHQVVTLYTRLN